MAGVGLKAEPRLTNSTLHIPACGFRRCIYIINIKEERKTYIKVSIVYCVCMRLMKP